MSLKRKNSINYTFSTKKYYILFNRLLNSAKKVLEEAEKMHRSGDEENAYIFYMKYFNLITIIQKSKDFPVHKGEMKTFLGTNSDINKRFDLLEKLKSSLKKR